MFKNYPNKFLDQLICWIIICGALDILFLVTAFIVTGEVSSISRSLALFFVTGIFLSCFAWFPAYTETRISVFGYLFGKSFSGGIHLVPFWIPLKIFQKYLKIEDEMDTRGKSVVLIFDSIKTKDHAFANLTAQVFFQPENFIRIFDIGAVHALEVIQAKLESILRSYAASKTYEAINSGGNLRLSVNLLNSLKFDTGFSFDQFPEIVIRNTAVSGDELRKAYIKVKEAGLLNETFVSYKEMIEKLKRLFPNMSETDLSRYFMFINGQAVPTFKFVSTEGGGINVNMN